MKPTSTFLNPSVALRVRSAVCSKILPLLLLVLGLSGCVNTPGNFLDAKQTFLAAPETQASFNSAYGYALFPTIGKAGVIVGGARGAGGVFRNEQVVGESTITQLSAGFQLGGQAYSQIIFFEDQRAFDEFCSGTFEFGANATAVAITASASASAASTGSNTSRSKNSQDALLTGGYHKGAAVFTVSKGGVLYEVSISGQKFSTQC